MAKYRRLNREKSIRRSGDLMKFVENTTQCPKSLKQMG